MSLQSATSLPMGWVDRIFDKLTLVYGQSFLRRWSDIDMAAVKADWAHELGGFERHPSAIAWALQHLPADKAPTVLEFRALARKAPPEERPRLEAPRATPSKVAEAISKVDLTKPRENDPRGWARRIVKRHEAGERIAPACLRLAREALEGYQ